MTVKTELKTKKSNRTEPGMKLCFYYGNFPLRTFLQTNNTHKHTYSYTYNEAKKEKKKEYLMRVEVKEQQQ